MVHRLNAVVAALGPRTDIDQRIVLKNGTTVLIPRKNWIIRRLCGEYSVAIMPPGSALLLLEEFSDEYKSCVHISYWSEGLKGMVESGELENRLFREIAHKLGIREFDGHPVDEWFSDECFSNAPQ